jgi:hypothetical protein
VLFSKARAIPIANDKNQLLVPQSDILAVLDTPQVESDLETRFFAVPDWTAFQENVDRYAVWKDWEFINSFNFRIRFHESFTNLGPLARRIYEHCVARLAPETSFAAIDLDVQEAPPSSLRDLGVYMVKCADDRYAGVLTLHGGERLLDLIRPNLGLRELITTTPLWMRALHGVLLDPVFEPVFGTCYSRVTIAAMHIKQIIRLLPNRRGETVRNQEVVGRLVRLGLEGGDLAPSLQQLGLGPTADLGRVDLKLGFQRKIGADNRDYRIFLNVEAPGNDERTQLHLTWEIQAERPTDLLTRDFGTLLTSFFRDVVLKGFYPTWLKSVTCTTGPMGRSAE